MAQRDCAMTEKIGTYKGATGHAEIAIASVELSQATKLSFDATRNSISGHDDEGVE